MEVKGHCEPQYWMGVSDKFHTHLAHKEFLYFHHMLSVHYIHI